MTHLVTMFRRTIIVVLMATLCAVTVHVPETKAQLATFEANPAVVAAIVASGNAAIVDRAKEDLLDGLAWTVAKVAVQSVTRSIVTWINSGYQGSPAFSQNLTRDLRQLGDAVASGFISDFFSANIDSPFLSTARDAVSVYYLMTSGDALEQRLKYTLANYALDSAAYMRGNWQSGGLSGWYGLTFKCENDPTCASFLVQETLINKVDAHVQKMLADFNAGRGFLSWPGECHDPVTTTSLSDEKKCINQDWVTPGSVVEQSLVDTLGSPIRQLELADSINEIISAVVVQMVNQVLGGGGLAGVSAPRSGGGGTPLDRATNPVTGGSTMNDGFISTVERARERAIGFRETWLEIRAAALLAQDACSSSGGALGSLRSSEIEIVIEDATDAIDRANTAVEKMDDVLTLLQQISDNSGSSANQALLSQRAYETYQKLLTDGILITETEFNEANLERDEDSAESMYSRMITHASDCD